MLHLFFSQLTLAQATQSYSAKDFTHWLDAAYIAQATYQSTDNIEAVLKQQGYTLDVSRQITGFSVAYVVATNDVTKQHIVAVRGTSNIKNAVVDAAFVLVADKISGIDLHQGFLLSARDIYQEIYTTFMPGYTINTIGHSLGGAAALILAMMLDRQGFPIGEVITFGQPKVTNISGSRKFNHLNIKRLVTPKDIVPLVPPFDPMDMMNFSIFWHQGTEIILYAERQYATLTGMKSMLRAADFLNDIPSQQHINNHFMTTYIAHLKTKLHSPIKVTYQSDFNFSDWFGTPMKSTSNQQ
ncbi:MAG: lipase family protein [Gammaproteobacteria bacterium]|nr:lipase family protein [Gammaproteobacteria bacterium]